MHNHPLVIRENYASSTPLYLHHVHSDLPFHSFILSKKDYREVDNLLPHMKEKSLVDSFGSLAENELRYLGGKPDLKRS